MTIRDLPAWRIVRLMKERRLRQLDVALRVGVSTSFVCETIHREKPKGHPKAEKVWRILEEELNAAS